MSARKSRSLPRPIIYKIQDIYDLIDEQHWQEAYQRLNELDKRYMDHPEVLEIRLEIAQALGNHTEFVEAGEALLEQEPNRPDLLHAVGHAYLMKGHIVLASEKFERILEEHPTYSESQQIRNITKELNIEIAEQLAETDLPGIDVARKNEQVQLLLNQQKLRQARQIAETLIREHPNFAPPYNNLSLIYWQNGQLEKAIATEKEVLTFEPDNIHALANLVQFLYLQGQKEEATTYAERLKRSQSEGWEAAVKRVEALTYLEDFEGVLNTTATSEEEMAKLSPRNKAYVYHLAAVAAARLGNEEQAMKYWVNSLSHDPSLSLAQHNLEDFQQPVGERHAPWPFLLGNWLSLPAIHALKEHAERTTKYGDTDKGQKRAEKAGERLFQRYPILEERIPLLLMRGDPFGRQMAYLIATMIETPKTLDALKTFAFSQRGPDQLRMEAAQVLVRAGAIPSGPQRLWLKGEWREMMLIGIEISPEPMRAFSHDVERLMMKGTEALHAGQGARAERYFKAALEKEPESPSILNNLTAAYEMQGKQELVDEMLIRIRRDFPDYFFGLVTEARILIQEGELESAQEMLNPLLQRRRLHTTEMSALCNALVDLAIERGEMENARQWLEIWERVYPDHPRLEYYRFMLA